MTVVNDVGIYGSMYTCLCKDCAQFINISELVYLNFSFKYVNIVEGFIVILYSNNRKV